MSLSRLLLPALAVAGLSTGAIVSSLGREPHRRQAQAHGEPPNARRELSRVDDVENIRIAKRMLPEDVSEYPELVKEAHLAIAEARIDDANRLLAEAATRLEHTAVDAQLIHRKLDRMSKLARAKTLDDVQRQTITNIFARVHAAYVAGDYETANAELTALQVELAKSR
jgi:hypothetical protein